MRFFPAALMVFALAAPVSAASLADAVPGRADVTYEALLRQVIPDLHRADEGRSAFWTSEGISIRDADGEMRETGVISLSSASTLPLRHAGKDLLAVMAEDRAGEGWLAIVAVYDMTPATPKLIDAVDAGMDRMTSPGATLALSDGDSAITVNGAHGNSNEYFETFQVLMLLNGRIASVMSGGAYSLQVCGMEMKQAGELTVVPDPGKPYAALAHTVTQEIQRPAGDCGDDAMDLPPAGVTTARDVFHWDAAVGKYVAATTNAAQLMGPE